MNGYLVIACAFLTFATALVICSVQRKSILVAFFAAWMLYAGIRALNRGLQEPEPEFPVMRDK